MKRILLLLVLAAGAVWGQCQQGVGIPTLPRIQGFVRGAEDAPQAGVKLELVRLKTDGTEDAVVGSVSTDKAGRFRFKRVKDLDYHVRVTVGERRLQPVRVRQGSVAMLPGGGLMNFVFYVDGSDCVGISMAE